MALWKPYEDKLRTLLQADVVRSVPSAETQPLASKTDYILHYTYCGYDPVPAFSPIVPLGTNSSNPLGSTAAPYTVKLSRALGQMRKLGTKMPNLQQYYTTVPKKPKMKKPNSKKPNSKKRKQVSIKQLKGTEYLEKRRKNNESAKRCRKTRKMKEDQLVVYLAWLERENRMLNEQLKSAKEMLKMYGIQKQ